MPNYDLRCTTCGKESKISASISEKSEKRIPCPNCDSFELETVFKSPPAYVKGTSAANCPTGSGCGSGCRHLS